MAAASRRPNGYRSYDTDQLDEASGLSAIAARSMSDSRTSESCSTCGITRSESARRQIVSSMDKLTTFAVESQHYARLRWNSSRSAGDAHRRAQVPHAASWRSLQVPLLLRLGMAKEPNSTAG